MVVIVKSRIEIARPVEHVRGVFLDFAHISDWQTHFTKVQPVSGKHGKDLIVGDKVKVTMPGMGTFTATIMENSPNEFRWKASLPLIFTGEHSFRFEESSSTTMKFLQEEKFTGALVGLMLGQEKTSKSFEGFDNALKRKAEGVL